MTAAGPTVLVVGARGILGGFIARSLAGEGYRVLHGSRRPETDPAFRLVDLDRPATVRRACAEVDVVVNTVVHPDLTVERTVLREGGTLLSVASLSLADRLELAREAGDDGTGDGGGSGEGLVVVHAGLNPGLMSLLLAQLVDEHPDADRLDLAATVAPVQTMGGLAFDYAWPFLTSRPRKAVAVHRFPDPVGARTCVELGQGEEGWLGGLGREREGHVWITMIQRSMNALAVAANRVGQMHRFPRWSMRPLQGRSRSRFCEDPKRDWVAVSRGGDRLAAAHILGVGDYRVSVDATATFLEALLRLRQQQPGLRGVHGAERLFRMSDLEPRLADRAIRVCRCDLAGCPTRTAV